MPWCSRRLWQADEQAQAYRSLTLKLDQSAGGRSLPVSASRIPRSHITKGRDFARCPPGGGKLSPLFMLFRLSMNSMKPHLLNRLTNQWVQNHDGTECALPVRGHSRSAENRIRTRGFRSMTIRITSVPGKDKKPLRVEGHLDARPPGSVRPPFGGCRGCTGTPVPFCPGREVSRCFSLHPSTAA